MASLYTCPEHFDKYIFHSKQDAVIFMRTYYPKKRYEIYPCPATHTHFHIKSYKTRRRTAQQRHEQRQRAKARKLENEE